MRRKTKIVVIVLSIMVAAIGVKLGVDKYSLSVYREFVEHEYGDIISLIEQTMPSIVSPYASSGRVAQGRAMARLTNILDANRAASERVKARLTSPDIREAYWSSDGHHDLSTLKADSRGHVHFTLIRSYDANRRHSLCFGRASDGGRIIVYSGHVPGAYLRHYRLVFDAARVKEKMRNR